MMTPQNQQVEEQATELNWCCLNVILDDETTELFQMPAPDGDAEQQPVFRVTNSTADLVIKDFARYQPSLQRMVDDWREAKDRAMQEEKAANPTAVTEQYEPTKAC
jgi:hypothetical protein